MILGESLQLTTPFHPNWFFFKDSTGEGGPILFGLCQIVQDSQTFFWDSDMAFQGRFAHVQVELKFFASL